MSITDLNEQDLQSLADAIGYEAGIDRFRAVELAGNGDILGVFEDDVPEQGEIRRFAFRITDPDEPSPRRVFRRIATIPMPTNMRESYSFGAIVDRIIDVGDLVIGVEYLPGQVRFKNSRKLRSGYGHLRGYQWQRKAPDCYLHPDLLDGEDVGDRPLYLVTQLNPDTEETDEYKLMVGYPSQDAAEAAYLREMPSPDYLGGIRAIALQELEQWRKAPIDMAESGIKKGTVVTWKFGTGKGVGKVIRVYRRTITLTLGESEISRNGTEENPAILIAQSNGGRVLKLMSEVEQTDDYAEAIDLAGELLDDDEWDAIADDVSDPDVIRDAMGNVEL